MTWCLWSSAFENGDRLERRKKKCRVASRNQACYHCDAQQYENHTCGVLHPDVRTQYSVDIREQKLDQKDCDEQRQEWQEDRFSQELEDDVNQIGFTNIRAEYVNQLTFPSLIVYAEKTAVVAG